VLTIYPYTNFNHRVISIFYHKGAPQKDVRSHGEENFSSVKIFRTRGGSSDTWRFFRCGRPNSVIAKHLEVHYCSVALLTNFSFISTFIRPIVWI